VGETPFGLVIRLGLTVGLSICHDSERGGLSSHAMMSSNVPRQDRPAKEG